MEAQGSLGRIMNPCAWKDGVVNPVSYVSVTMQSDMCDLWNIKLIQYYEISLMH